ncbi:MAG: polysaccharide pyruvyl transferase family protein [Lachnospiraceae bacterium]
MNDVGILTFHCSDNYGAMLQAYGLKEYLKQKNVKAEIVRYEPPYMTGRHWWIPYIPVGGLTGILYYGLRSWKRNLRLGKTFFEKRANMERFRKEYLTEENRKKLYWDMQLKQLSYQYYVVGSDQIWNPSITCGLRKAYFGCFKNPYKKKVIAYAASLGSAVLPSKYDKQFGKLIKYVDAISVREKVSVPYVKQFYDGPVSDVLDPVFLLEAKAWKKIEKVPVKKKYIFIYMTERNDKLVEYAKELSLKRGLEIIKVTDAVILSDKAIITDRIAGPSEFLGYIHQAEYVISNSFHVIAFSIIFHKNFTAFLHSSVGERISNILQISGLENRFYQENIRVEEDGRIDWKEVEKRIGESVQSAGEFLMKNIGQGVSF